jgi:hypothetical protein
MGKHVLELLPPDMLWTVVPDHYVVAVVREVWSKIKDIRAQDGARAKVRRLEPLRVRWVGFHNVEVCEAATRQVLEEGLPRTSRARPDLKSGAAL